MAALSPSAARGAGGDAGRRVAGRVRRHGDPAGRTRPRRCSGRPRRRRRWRRSSHKLGLDLPLSVRYARWIAGLAARRSRRLLRLRLADRAADRREPFGQPSARRHGDGAVGGDRARGRRLRGRPARAGGRRGGDGLTQVGLAVPNFWLGDPDGDRVRGHAAPRSGRRLSRLGRSRPRRRRADPAGGRARRRAGGDPDPRHPVGADRGARRGLHAHGARQGRVAPRGALAPRAAERARCRC